MRTLAVTLMRGGSTSTSSLVRLWKDSGCASIAFERALSLRPDDPALLLNLGNTYVRQGRLTEAIVLFDKARNHAAG